MAAPGSSAPRKFSDKIALQKKRQAEEMAAFVEVMADLSSARVQVQKLRMTNIRGSCYGGSLPNVNQIGSGTAEFQGPPQSPLDPSRSTRHHGLVERVHRDPRRMMSPLRRYMRQVDSSPYNVAYLSPHQDNNWRRTAPWGPHPSDAAQLFRLPSALNRTNSDSALHTSVMNPSSQEPYMPGPQGPPTRRSAFLFPAIEEPQSLGPHLLKPCDSKKPPSASGRPKSCEVPGINIYPSVDQPPSVPAVSSVLNTGGSLPDLTNLHFPPPLHTPLDPDESGFGSLSGGSSTGNLASTMTHLGISGLPPTFNSAGFSSDLQTCLSRQSLQSSLSNPNLQASLRSASLQTSYSNPSLQSSLSSQSLPSSLSNQSLSPSASSHSLTSPSSSSSSSFPPMTSTSLNTSPHRRVPLSPLTLPMAGDGRRQHQKQFSPTMSPTLTSITQGVPLDTSKMAADQRLPPYHFSHPNLLHQSAQQMPQAQQPNSHQPPQGMGNSQQHSHQPPQGMGNSQQHLHQPPQGMGSSQQHLHQPPQGMGSSQQHLHQPPQGMGSTQQHLHQPPQGMGSSQQHLHQPPQGMGSSQQHLHQPPQGMGSSQQHLHQPTQGMGSSQQHLHQLPVPQSQQPYHQSQNPLSCTTPTMSQQSKQCLNQQPMIDISQEALQQPLYKDVQGLQSDNQNFYQQSSGGLPFPPFLADYQLSNSLLSSLFDDCDLPIPGHCPETLSQQQCHVTENRRLGLAGDFAHTVGGTFRKQNSGSCFRHEPVPDIILTAVDSPPGLSKEITTALSSVPGFEVDPSLGLEDDLTIGPLTLDGLNMLSDPYAPLTDPLVEDSFRSDRLQ